MWNARHMGLHHAFCGRFHKALGSYIPGLAISTFGLTHVLACFCFIIECIIGWYPCVIIPNDLVSLETQIFNMAVLRTLISWIG